MSGNLLGNHVKDILTNKCGFHWTLLASGSTKLVKALPNGARVHIKEITPSFIAYDIDIDDPEQWGHLTPHYRSWEKWKRQGKPNKTKEVKLEKILKKILFYEWVKEYEKEFELIYYPNEDIRDWEKKPRSFFRQIKNFFKWGKNY